MSTTEKGSERMTGKSEVVERGAILSESILWQLQRDYFDREGVKAWHRQVPYFVTSNTYIANCYANLVVNFIRDWLTKHPDAISQSFYILELGTGVGQLSFYVIKRVKALCKALNLDTLKFKYVMSDFTENNLNFWQSQPELKKFVDEGILDFAIYNMEADHDIELVYQKMSLSSETLKNPMIVFANYIFDTIAHDGFSIKDNTLSEVKLTISTEKSNYQNKTVQDMQGLKIDFTEDEIKMPYYSEQIFNDILDYYKENLIDSKILLPISSLRAIAKLRELSNDKLFLISSDKGYNNLSQLDWLKYPHISFHGSFSMMVNFHAIAEYFKRTGGHYIFQTPREGIKTCLFTTGINFSELPNTQSAINQYVEGFSPADYFIMHRHMSDTFKEAKLDTLVSHLVLTQYDPYMFNRVNEHIRTLVESAKQATIDHLLISVSKIADNFYFTPSAHDLMFDIAFLYQILNQYNEACQYYQRSIDLFGKKFGTIYNGAICQYNLANFQDSLAQFQEAKKIAPDDEYTNYVQEWIEMLSKTEEQ